MSVESDQKVRIFVPELGDAGVAAKARQALQALPGVTRVLPNLSANELVVRTAGSLAPAQLIEALGSLGIQGMVR